MVPAEFFLAGANAFPRVSTILRPPLYSSSGDPEEHSEVGCAQACPELAKFGGRSKARAVHLLVVFLTLVWIFCHRFSLSRKHARPHFFVEMRGAMILLFFRCPLVKRFFFFVLISVVAGT